MTKVNNSEFVNSKKRTFAKTAGNYVLRYGKGNVRGELRSSIEQAGDEARETASKVAAKRAKKVVK